MKFLVQLLAAMAGIGLVAIANADDVTDRISSVLDFQKAAVKSCVPSTRHGGAGEIWNLKEKSEFDFRKVGVNRYSISRISVSIDGEIEAPAYFHVNPQEDYSPLPPCNGASLARRQLLFAIHELQEPGHDHSESWHALIYVPVKISQNSYEFYLVVLSIANDTTSCDDFDGKRKKQCQAIRKLAAMKMDGKPQQTIRDEFLKKIDDILPPSGFAVITPDDEDRPAIRYHNGVIHGSF